MGVTDVLSNGTEIILDLMGLYEEYDANGKVENDVAYLDNGCEIVYDGDDHYDLFGQFQSQIYEMDGETCIVIDVDTDDEVVILLNENGEKDVQFEMDFSDIEICGIVVP